MGKIMKSMDRSRIYDGALSEIIPDLVIVERRIRTHHVDRALTMRLRNPAISRIAATEKMETPA